jgi:hypothetical protein
MPVPARGCGADHHHQHAIDGTSSSTGSKELSTKVLFTKATLLLETGARHGQADRLLEESLGLFQELKDTTWTVRAIPVLGWAMRRAGQLDRALALQDLLTRHHGALPEVQDFHERYTVVRRSVSQRDESA